MLIKGFIAWKMEIIEDSYFLSLLMWGTTSVASPDKPIFFDHDMLHRAPVHGKFHQYNFPAHNSDWSVANSIMSALWT